MERIQVEFIFSAEIFGETQRRILWNYFTSGWLKWVLLLLAAVWVLKKVLYDDPLELFLSLAIMGMFLGLWWLIFKWLSKRTFSRFPALQHPISYSFGTDNITLNTHTSQSVLSWDTFKKVTETNNFFLLHQTMVAANPILKSGFKSEADIARFRDLLREKGLMGTTAA